MMATSVAPPGAGFSVVRGLRDAKRGGRRVVDRYRVELTTGGAVLHCDETPGIDVRIDASFAFSEVDARKLGPRTILLDGAGAFAPMIDGEAKLYNLDHHQGCVRAFTLATCEQALVLVAKGLDLDRGGWTVYANEADLDVVLALWVLLNHRRVVQLGDAEREILLPLLRLEGAIDAIGTEASSLCGLPAAALDDARRRIDHLFQREQSLRALPTLDATARTAALLREVDAIVFAETDFGDFRPVEELLGNSELSDELVAVACRDSAGIYDVERRLRERWGARLGLIVLQSPSGRYTLRASATLAGVRLAPLYALLNLVDPAVDGRPDSQRWGGSDEIGGSPRDRRSRLTPDGVLRAARWVARRPLRTARAAANAVAASVAVALAAALAAPGLLEILGASVSPHLEACVPLATSGAIALAAASLLTRRQARTSFEVPGWRRPAGRIWLPLMAPVVALAGAGGAWLPAPAGADPAALVASASAAALAALGFEAWFRGWVHGLIQLASPPRASERPPLVSRATVVSAALYAFAMLAAQRPADAVPTAVAALLAGLTLGALRERSRSLWPGIGAQLLAAALALWLRG